MNAFLWLLILSAGMVFGSVLAGLLPLTTKLSENQLRYLNIFGAGMLLGTALVVIIPEGVETYYDALQISATDNEEEAKDHHHVGIGLALLLGFALMSVIDNMFSLHGHARPSSSSTLEYNELSTVPDQDDTPDNQSHPFGQVHNGIKPRTTSSAATVAPVIGLMVHAMADGIALGASASQPQLSVLIFLAIMMHKAPAAFSLVMMLLYEGVARTQVKLQLFLFAIQAPVGAILTFLVLHLIPSVQLDRIGFWTGLLLIFSGGTFLFVAMHALQQANYDHQRGSAQKLTTVQLLTLLTGMVVPFILSLTHSH
ncbi:Zinc/iron permease [Radiomyces spectabilis]|uniref:Zinc/iron permease n=1 Tax=Radiomyces spectabilis TaxID=64574 RepID=UPI00221FAE6A|nr:Zinc/iron permease [Radiomyces spectabilis]KAI8370379.1 Zinc/iron permease [Radiomyces spectabilis]